MKKLTFLGLLAIILLSLINNKAHADRVARGVFGGALGGAAIGGLAGGGRGAAIGAGVGAGIGLAAGSAAEDRARRRYYNDRYYYNDYDYDGDGEYYTEYVPVRRSYTTSRPRSQQRVVRPRNQEIIYVN
jgi:hypothetical protein